MTTPLRTQQGTASEDWQIVEIAGEESQGASPQKTPPRTPTSTRAPTPKTEDTLSSYKEPPPNLDAPPLHFPVLEEAERENTEEKRDYFKWLCSCCFKWVRKKD